MQPRWVVTDLGTLGGSDGGAVAINNSGQVVGSSETGKRDADGNPIEHAFLWEKGKIHDLGSLGEASWAVAINARGEVIGNSWNANGRLHAFLWREDRMLDLGTLGGSQSWANAINDRGQIVGNSTVRSGEQHAVLWREGKIVDLGTLGGTLSAATAVNNRGQVVGWSKKPPSGGPYAVLWEGGRMRAIWNRRSNALAVNERGQIVGWSQITSFQDTRAAIWEEGKMLVLGTPREHGGEAWAINEHGLVVAKGSQGGRPFLWRSGARTDLATFSPSGSPFGINDHGQVVGHAYVKGAPAAVWERGKLVRLPHLPGCNVSYAEAINNRGQIVGGCESWSLTKTGNQHAVLWTPKR